MVTIRNFLFILFLIGYAASAYSYTNPDPTHITIVDGGKVIEMTPNGFDSGDPSQDTINLQWVFDTFPNADIHLGAGTFHISTMIEAENYQGNIEGAGISSTFLVGRGPLDNGEYVFPLLNADFKARLYPSGVPHLIWFHPATGDVDDWVTNKVDVKISDLTIRMDGVGPAVTLVGSPLRTIWSFIVVTGSEAVITEPTGNISHVQFEMKDVHMEAQDVAYTLNGENMSNANAAVGVLLYGGENWIPFPGLNGFNEIDHSPVNALVDIRDCSFERFHQFALGFETPYTTNPPGSGYTFPTSPAFPPASISVKDNTFTSIGDSAGIAGANALNILVLDPSETTVEIKDNTFTDIVGSGIVVLKGIAITIPQLLSFINIEDNSLSMTADPLNGSAINLFDFTFFSGTVFLSTIKDNVLTGGTDYDAALISHSMGTAATFEGNQFFGEASSAISLGNTNFPGVGILPVVQDTVHMNDYDNLTASVANVHLGPGSSFNTVTVDDAGDVLDQGIANTIIVE